MSNPRWQYGDAGDRYPVKVGQTWTVGPHTLFCGDLENGDGHDFIDQVGRMDMVYVDPPWDVGNAKSFRTKAGVPNPDLDFPKFIKNLLTLCRKAAPIAFVEAGRRNSVSFQGWAKESGADFYGPWEFTYFRKEKNVGHLYVLAWEDQMTPHIDFNGMDDMDTPALAIREFSDKGDHIFDPCTGRGQTAVSADKLGRVFYGMELHPRRLAVTIDKLVKQGAGEAQKVESHGEG